MGHRARAALRPHFLGEHNEIHGLRVVITENRKGFSSYPETFRLKGRVAALYDRHAAIATEMKNKGYNHASPLDRKLALSERFKARFSTLLKSKLHYCNQKMFVQKPASANMNNELR